MAICSPAENFEEADRPSCRIFRVLTPGNGVVFICWRGT